jgi:hypothetical protein
MIKKTAARQAAGGDSDYIPFPLSAMTSAFTPSNALV